ncbi:MAG: GTPase HflX [Candidatus Latescibacteria bacterium]|nr:GTPase HflX [Candidatus Latescibacterota bacterium]
MDHIFDAQGIRRAILVGVAQHGISALEARESLAELAHLASTATFEEVGRILQNRDKPDPASYIGSGKVDELREMAREKNADAIIFDNDLSPSQMRNLETRIEARILDRSLLILDIFALHARTRTAQIQVKMAHLRYLRPRIRQFNPHAERRAGGGSGETHIETTRRLIGQREQALYGSLKRVRRQMATGRKARKNGFNVTLVGYTNAGKSTLMRGLSGENVLVQNQLFATLTNTTRTVDVESYRPILLTDTVGFINRLPHHLFASFRATLQEAVQADLLLHVVDASHPQYEMQMTSVNEVLAKLNIDDKPILIVYNKMDLANSERQKELSERCATDDDALAISALDTDGLNTLKSCIRDCLAAEAVTLELHVPQSEGKLLSQLYARSEILTQDYENNDVHLRVRLNPNQAERLQLNRFALV